MVIIVGKVVAGDLVAIQYEGRLEGEDGEIFHATELRQPFVFVVRRILTNLVVVLTKQNQVSPGAALTGLVAGTFNMLATMTICSPSRSAQSCPSFVLAQSCRCRGARDVQGRGSKSSPSSKSCLGRETTFSSSSQLQCPLQGGTYNRNITAVIMTP